MTNQYKKLPVTMKMWMQFNVMPRTIETIKHTQRVQHNDNNLPNINIYLVDDNIVSIVVQ